MYTAECPKKMRLCFCLTSWHPSTGFSKKNSPENWDPFVNFEYITISVWFLKAEIFAKQKRILNFMILIKLKVFNLELHHFLKTIKINTVITSSQSFWATRPTRSHLGAIRAPLGPVGKAWRKFCRFEATMTMRQYEH